MENKDCLIKEYIDFLKSKKERIFDFHQKNYSYKDYLEVFETLTNLEYKKLNKLQKNILKSFFVKSLMAFRSMNYFKFMVDDLAIYLHDNLDNQSFEYIQYILKNFEKDNQLF